MIPKIRSWIGARLFTLQQRSRWIFWSARLKHIGTNSNIYPDVRIYGGRSVSIGSHVSINDFVHIWGNGGVTIGDNTLIASHATITSQTHDIHAMQKGLLYRETNIHRGISIGKNVWIGAGAIILPGVSIGDNSVVAAGSVVTKDVHNSTLVAGVPAKAVRSLELKSTSDIAQSGTPMSPPISNTHK